VTPRLHLSDEEVIGEALAVLDRPRPPADFTATLLARLPPAPPAVSADDLVAVGLAAGAAVLAGVLFFAGGGASALLDLFRAVPGQALAEAAIAAVSRGRGQISVLLSLSLAALVIGAPLWRVLSERRAIA
jgi:hypothetical protein